MAFATTDEAKKYNREYYLKNRDRMRARMRAWREKNGERHRAKSREYHYKNRDTLLPQKRARWKENAEAVNVRRREKKFGLSAGAYAEMHAAQGGRCAVCSDLKKLVVDHDHGTGAVRALLCGPCNTAIGLFKESPKRLRAAIKYLAKSGALEAPQGAMQ